MSEKTVEKRVAELVSGDMDFAVATIISASKGSPRKSGTKMIIFPDRRTEFTIGGGKFEEYTINQALEALCRGENRIFKSEFREEKDGMICGGDAEVFIEINRSVVKIIIFGGGHIGLALAGFCDVLGLSYTVIDDRKEYASEERFPRAETVKVLPYDDAAGKLHITENTYCVIVTQGHSGDEAVLRGLIQTPAPYMGMIGSVKKTAHILGKIAPGIKDADRDRIYAPVGLDLGGRSPAEIAAAVIAEILKVRYGSTGRSLRERLND
ncbi:MAG: XdhC family protein [Elusimicrobiota bacterium]